jgi:hypothetical protein
MYSLFMIFFTQVIFCVLVFILIYHFIKKNAELKEEIKSFKEASRKREVN